MYIPGHFKINDPVEIRSFVRAHPFGMLLTNGVEVPEVTHLPMQLKSDDGHNDAISFHMAKANPHSKSIVDGEKSVAVFRGVHGYISPRWYEAKDNVPTWNYIVVHAVGVLRKIEKKDELIKLVDSLSAEHEASADIPWKADWSDSKINNFLNAITGFEMRILNWEGKKKLSQNKSEFDQAILKKNLEQSEEEDYLHLAQQMKTGRN